MNESLNRTKSLCERYDVGPKKSFGQNFLVDQRTLSSIVSAAAPLQTDHVLEIGPGIGTLTGELIKTGADIVSVELDRRLLKLLEDEYGSCENFKLVHGNILNISNVKIAEIFGGAPYILIANIPYNITGRILRKFLTEAPRPISMVLMIQKEVAQRIVSDPGEMSLVALLCQIYADVEIVTYVGRNSFYPAPDVDSAVVKFTLAEKNLFKNESHEKMFWRIAHAGFGNKRKQLAANLSAISTKDKDWFKKTFVSMGFSETVRAQELTPLDWVVIAEMCDLAQKSKGKSEK